VHSPTCDPLISQSSTFVDHKRLSYDLQMFGIQASQIDMTEDGRLQFDPCFFQPYPETVLEKYPLDPLNMDEGTESLNLLSD